MGLKSLNKNFRQQIEDTERNLIAMSKQQSLTPQGKQRLFACWRAWNFCQTFRLGNNSFFSYLAELMGTMKKLHEAFVLLAGRVHMIHSTLQNYKDDYLSYRRRVLGDSTDIFANKGLALSKSSVVSQLNKIGSGPSPFGGKMRSLSLMTFFTFNKIGFLREQEIRSCLYQEWE